MLSHNQYKFRKNHSTDMALIDITEKISQAVDNRLYSAGIFIDLSKTFDTVDHLILLSKLNTMESVVCLMNSSKLISALGNNWSLLLMNFLINF